jgi:hypothetical protein
MLNFAFFLETNKIKTSGLGQLPTKKEIRSLYNLNSNAFYNNVHLVLGSEPFTVVKQVIIMANNRGYDTFQLKGVQWYDFTKKKLL